MSRVKLDDFVWRKNGKFVIPLWFLILDTVLEKKHCLLSKGRHTYTFRDYRVNIMEYLAGFSRVIAHIVLSGCLLAKKTNYSEKPNTSITFKHLFYSSTWLGVKNHFCINVQLWQIVKLLFFAHLFCIYVKPQLPDFAHSRNNNNLCPWDSLAFKRTCEGC